MEHKKICNARLGHYLKNKFFLIKCINYKNKLFPNPKHSEVLTNFYKLNGKQRA